MRADPHTVPDISIGKWWATHWKEKELAKRFGPRQKTPHFYPEYYAQAQANGMPVNVYPEGALGEFRRWLREEYVPGRLRNYLEDKEDQGLLDRPKVRLILRAAGYKGLLPPPEDSET